jgi:hypothetical protein
MIHRAFLSSLAVLVACGAAVPATASAGSGFTVPSRNTTCGILGKDKAGSGRPGLYCESSYIPGGVGESMGAAELGRTGKARKISIGNDSSLYIGGWHEDGNYDKRPVLRYGKSWKRGGYRCVSRSNGLTCRRGAHGFFLSRESQRYF